MKKINLVVGVLAFTLLAGCVPPPADPGAAPSQGGFLASTVWFFVLGLFGYYILVTRPTLMAEADQKKFLEGLKKNDEVVTSSGIYGRVVSTQDGVVTIEIAQNVRIRVAAANVRPVPAKKSDS